ncbi:MAG: methyltransferase [Pseudomonadota bacterium]
MREAWLNFRDRCLTSPRFHKFAAGFHPTRPVTRKRQAELFDLVSGFVYSQILLAVVQLDVLGAVANGGKTIAELAHAIDLPEDETRRLAEGAASLRILEVSGKHYRLGDLGAVLSINPGVKAMILHHGALYRDLTDPVALLRAGREPTHLSRYWDYALSDDPKAADAEDVSAYSTLMSESQTMVAEEVAATFDFTPFETLLDMGGGEGRFLQIIAEANPHLDLHLFDLPQVAARAEARWADLPQHLHTHGGSFFEDPLPKGADLISLVRILHDHDDGPALDILRAAYDALPDGGSLIVCEPMSDGGTSRRICDAYFNFYLYAMGSGRPRTPETVMAMLKATGFSTISQIATRAPLITGMIHAIR